MLLTSDLAELRNIATVAELIIACAQRRAARAAACTTPSTIPDAPIRRWLRDTVVRRAGRAVAPEIVAPRQRRPLSGPRRSRASNRCSWRAPRLVAQGDRVLARVKQASQKPSRRRR